MAELLRTFEEPVLAADGARWSARACGAARPDGRWEGWIELTAEGDGQVVRSQRETTQPSLEAARYWAGGLTHVYLEGALQRALQPLPPAAPPPRPAPAFTRPAPPPGPPTPAPAARPVLDPFSVYAKGEDLLRQELKALHSRHLRTIARAYRLADERRVALDALTRDQLAELIVEAVRENAPQPLR
jgi:hypothetical protein